MTYENKIVKIFEFELFFCYHKLNHRIVYDYRQKVLKSYLCFITHPVSNLKFIFHSIRIVFTIDQWVLVRMEKLSENKTMRLHMPRLLTTKMPFTEQIVQRRSAYFSVFLILSVDTQILYLQKQKVSAYEVGLKYKAI